MYSCVSRKVGLEADCHEPHPVDELAEARLTGHDRAQVRIDRRRRLGPAGMHQVGALPMVVLICVDAPQ